MTHTKKTIVVERGLDQRIVDLVEASRRNGIILDYNTAINLFAELGRRWLEESVPAERVNQRQVLSKYLDCDKFEASVKSDWIELEEFRKWKLKTKESKG